MKYLKTSPVVGSYFVLTTVVHQFVFHVFSASSPYSNVPSLLMGYVVPSLITTMDISDSLIIAVAYHNMLGSPMFVRIPLQTCHSILPRGTSCVLLTVATAQISGFVFSGRLTIPDLRNEA